MTLGTFGPLRVLKNEYSRAIERMLKEEKLSENDPKVINLKRRLVGRLRTYTETRKKARCQSGKCKEEYMIFPR